MTGRLTHELKGLTVSFMPPEQGPLTPEQDADLRALEQRLKEDILGVLKGPPPTAKESFEITARFIADLLKRAMELPAFEVKIEQEDCTWCSGDGFVGCAPCRECGSTGKVQDESRVQETLPVPRG